MENVLDVQICKIYAVLSFEKKYVLIVLFSYIDLIVYCPSSTEDEIEIRECLKEPLVPKTFAIMEFSSCL